MLNYAYEIKCAVPSRTLFEFYGFEINRSGFCRSPFASDSTPSLKVYSGQRGWHDFSSGKGGDVIDFVREYFGLGFVDAQKKINEDFKLGLPIGEKLSREQQLEANRKAIERKNKIEEKKKAHNELLEEYYVALDRWIYLDNLKQENEPKAEKEFLHDNEKMGKWIYYLKYIGLAEYNLDVSQVKLREFEMNSCNYLNKVIK